MTLNGARYWWLAALAATFNSAAPAAAHPHVWVSVQTTVIYENGTVKALHHRWLFDEFYSSMAVEDLDANKDGVYDRSELAELAKVNIEGLKEFGYFTAVTLGNQAVPLSAPSEYWMELTEASIDPAASAQPAGNGGGQGNAPAADTSARKRMVLALEFTLPLGQPVLAEAEEFGFSVADPSFFIWFDLVKDDPVTLAGAPPGCKALVEGPGGPLFSTQRLGDQANAMAVGMNASKTVKLECPR
jgi:ABC-type uncharacterized transport system substrate-binding protein